MAFYAQPMLMTPSYGAYGRAAMPWNSYPMFPHQGYPVWNTMYPGQMLPGNMYFKPIWTPRREMKLYSLYCQVVADGIITPHEIQYVLHKFGYHIDFYIAQWVLFNLDRNRDGRISFDEFKLGVMQFIVGWPRVRNPMKPMMKPHYMPGFNWATNPMFMTSPYSTMYRTYFRF